MSFSAHEGSIFLIHLTSRVGSSFIPSTMAWAPILRQWFQDGTLCFYWSFCRKFSASNCTSKGGASRKTPFPSPRNLLHEDVSSGVYPQKEELPAKNIAKPLFLTVSRKISGKRFFPSMAPYPRRPSFPFFQIPS